MRPTFGRVFVLPLCLIIAGLAVAALVLRADPQEPDACDPACVALGHAVKRHRDAADSLVRVAALQETVYVARRAKAQQAVAAIPSFDIAKDTIVLTEGRFPVAVPVVALIQHLRVGLDAQTARADQADTVIATLHGEIAAKDSEQVASDSLHAAKERAWIASQPSRIARLWDGVKAPLAFVGGVAVALLAVR